jgi:cell division protein FtsB
MSLDFNATTTLLIGAIIGYMSAATVVIIQAVSRMKLEVLEAQYSLHRQLDRQDAKAEEIHHLVDGSASAATQREAVLSQRVEELKSTIELLQHTVATVQAARVADAKESNGHSK